MMTTISQTSLMKDSGVNLTQVEIALEGVAYGKNSLVTVSNSSSGTTINGSSISQFSVSNKITQDTISFSPAAVIAVSNQQIALNVLQNSEGKSNKDVSLEAGKNTVNVAIDQMNVAPILPSISNDSTTNSEEGSTALGDPSTLLANYSLESPEERFYNSSEDASAIPKEFFSSPEQQASYIAAYNSGSLNIQSATSFENSEFSSTTSFSSNGMSSSDSGLLDLSSIKDKNIFTFNDPIAGSIVISWTDK